MSFHLDDSFVPYSEHKSPIKGEDFVFSYDYQPKSYYGPGIPAHTLLVKTEIRAEIKEPETPIIPSPITLIQTKKRRVSHKPRAKPKQQKVSSKKIKPVPTSQPKEEDYESRADYIIAKRRWQRSVGLLPPIARKRTKILYDVRKKFAESRPRVGGRFIKTGKSKEKKAKDQAKKKQKNDPDEEWVEEWQEPTPTTSFVSLQQFTKNVPMAHLRSTPTTQDTTV
jgi:hypothetical protein